MHEERRSEEHRSSAVVEQRAAAAGRAVVGDGGRGMLPLGMQTFREVRESGAYYVDKTGFAHRMIAEGKCYFLSRPRRFGKSLFVDMLRELFSGTEELFEGLFVHGRWDWSTARPVVRLDFSGGHFTEPDGLRTSVDAQLRRIQERAGVAAGYGGTSERFVQLLDELHHKSGRRVVVLVDEYDKPILDALGVSEVAHANRDFLRGLYGCLKSADAHVRFVFLAGVSKFSKVSLFSGLNNLKDITLTPAYSSLCGFTEADLDRVFAAELEGLDRSLVREWYNGYNWLGPERVYNPYDVLMLLDEREFRPHWFETGSSRFLVDILIERGVPTPSLTQPVDRDELLSSFDVEHVGTEALMFQSGYLTIIGTVDAGYGDVSYRLDYPNREVRQSLHRNLLRQLVGSGTARTAKRARLLEILFKGDTQGLRELFASFFAGIPYQWHTSGTAAQYESYYASVFYTYFAACGIHVSVEDFTNLGRVDMVACTPQNIWLFEFKTTGNSPPGAALAQIKLRSYADKYRSEGLPIILVGIEFDPETRSIAACRTATA